MHSRAYINFNRPEDVIEFAEFFNGHVFVNEKGNIHEHTSNHCQGVLIIFSCLKYDMSLLIWNFY